MRPIKKEGTSQFMDIDDMDIEEKFKELTRLSKKIKSAEFPAVTEKQQQAAIALAALESAVCELIMAGATPQILCFSLFYFWLKLDCPMRGLNKKQTTDLSMHIDQTILKTMIVVKRVVKSLPKQDFDADLSDLGKKLNVLKAHLTDEMFNPKMSHEEHVKKIEMVNEVIHDTTSELIKNNVHGEIIANVLFNYFLRVVNLRSFVSEEEHQKMEFYFTDIIKGVRYELSSLFRNVR